MTVIYHFPKKDTTQNIAWLSSGYFGHEGQAGNGKSRTKYWFQVTAVSKSVMKKVPGGIGDQVSPLT